MGSLKTTKEFVAEATVIHKGKYTYEKTVYNKSKVKVVVCCQEHGYFEITPSAHLKGQGCAKCKYEKVGNHNRGSLHESIFECKEVHQHAYSYEKVLEYKQNKQIITVTCPIHGDFNCTWNNHKRGRGCPFCKNDKIGKALKSNLEDTINDCHKVHNNKYDYSLVKEYNRNSDKASIICPVHGVFKQTWSNHKNGQACPECAMNGYHKTKPGTFYILLHENLTKVGITNRKAKDRLQAINRTSNHDFKIHTTISSEDGTLAANIETQVLRWLSQHYQPVQEVFDGSTECFVDVDLQKLLNYVSQFQPTELFSSQL